MNRIFQKIYPVYGKLVLISHINHLKALKFRNKKYLKLNVGCGSIKFPEWVNIDIEPNADICADVTKGLPFSDNSSKFIFNEHFIEHITYEEGEKVLKDFYRILEKGGILRIATPDLDYIIDKYNNNWKDQEWLTWPELQFIKTKGQMINISLRSWGHKYMYNEEDLRIQLLNAGFSNINRCDWNISSYEELSGRETRKDSILILEAEK